MLHLNILRCTYLILATKITLNKGPLIQFEQSTHNMQQPDRFVLLNCYVLPGRSQWPLGLSRRSGAARLLRLWFRIPTGELIFVSCECCLLSGRGLCDELITRSEESYRRWCVFVCDIETSWLMRPWPTGGCCEKGNRNVLPDDIM